MDTYEFSVCSLHPSEYRTRFYDMLSSERKKGNLSYVMCIEETAPPPELVKDIVLVTASGLTILKTLYDFYKETRKKKGKVIIKMNGKKFDLEAYNLEELKIKISEAQKT